MLGIPSAERLAGVPGAVDKTVWHRRLATERPLGRRDVDAISKNSRQVKYHATRRRREYSTLRL